jgi:hypothetical protein
MREDFDWRLKSVSANQYFGESPRQENSYSDFFHCGIILINKINQ